MSEVLRKFDRQSAQLFSSGFSPEAVGLRFSPELGDAKPHFRSSPASVWDDSGCFNVSTLLIPPPKVKPSTEPFTQPSASLQTSWTVTKSGCSRRSSHRNRPAGGPSGFTVSSPLIARSLRPDHSLRAEPTCGGQIERHLLFLGNTGTAADSTAESRRFLEHLAMRCRVDALTQNCPQVGDLGRGSKLDKRPGPAHLVPRKL
jgi:hypothetical protein